jgi:hypothetical protein
MKIIERLYFPFFMALFMSGLMSLQLLIIANGMSTDLISIWINTWPKAFLVAFPSAIVVSPIINKICTYLKSKPTAIKSEDDIDVKL